MVDILLEREREMMEKKGGGDRSEGKGLGEEGRKQ